MPEDRLKDYVDVKGRIRLFYEKHPDGRLVTVKAFLATAEDGRLRVWVKAKAYRTPDDPLPGVGWSWMEVPGSTPFTRGSELENTETSAWGRAIGALGIGIDKSIASADEIANKEGGETPERAAGTGPSRGEAEAFLGMLTKSGTIKKGGANGYKLERREGPEGPVFGFRLALDGDKDIPQVLVPPAVATPLLLDAGGDPAVLLDRTVKLKGQLFNVSQPARASYYRLVVNAWEDDERSIGWPDKAE